MKEPNRRLIQESLDTLARVVSLLPTAPADDRDRLLGQAYRATYELRLQAGDSNYILEKLDAIVAHLEGTDGKGSYGKESMRQNIAWCLQALGALRMHHGFGQVLDGPNATADEHTAASRTVRFDPEPRPQNRPAPCCAPPAP